jgi:hypothetical protein
MHNPETLTILDTQDTGRKQRKKKEKIQPWNPPNIRHPLCYSYSQDELETNICKQHKKYINKKIYSLRSRCLCFIILNVEVD